VAVHEIGHTLGLPHCPTRACLMEDAMGKVVTTDRERDFCPKCRTLAKQNGFAIAESPAAAWLVER
jgi:archaemetzincin